MLSARFYTTATKVFQSKATSSESLQIAILSPPHGPREA